MRGESSKSGIGPIIAGAIAGIALLGAVLCFYKHRKEHKRHKREAEQYRKQMKDERRNRRLAKENSTLSKDWRDNGNDEPRQESALPSICSTNTSSGSLAALPIPYGGEEKTAKTSVSLRSNNMFGELPLELQTPRMSIDSSASRREPQSPTPVEPSESTRMACAPQSPHCVDRLANLLDLQTLTEVSQSRSVLQRHIDNSAGTTRNDSYSRLSCTPTPQRKIGASTSNPEMVVNLNQGHIPFPSPPLRMSLTSSFGTRTPQRSIDRSTSAREPQTPRRLIEVSQSRSVLQRHIDNSAGTTRNDSYSRLSCTPSPKRKFAASKSNPEMIAAAKTGYQASPAPPRRRVRSVGSEGEVSLLSSRSASAVTCVSTGPGAKQANPSIQKVNRPTVQQASSDRPLSFPSPQIQRDSRLNSLDYIVPPLK